MRRARAYGSLTIGALAGAALFGCKPDPADCYSALPAFLVQIDAVPGPLPQDTRLRVKYGAGEDSVVGAASSPQQVIICTPNPGEDGGVEASLDPDAPDAREDANIANVDIPFDALLCELWTQGAATLTVEATGYAPVVRSLKASRDRCGIETVNVHVQLQAGDAGS